MCGMWPSWDIAVMNIMPTKLNKMSKGTLDPFPPESNSNQNPVSKNMQDQESLFIVAQISTHLWNRLNVFKKKAYTNNVDPDEMPQNTASHQGLCCLPR